MRAFCWFVGAIVLAGVIGAAVSYPAFELTTRFATFAFHRVASRIAMLVLIGELVWVCRHLKLNSKRDFGYALPWRRFLAVSFAWSLVGMGTALLGAAFLLGTGLRVLDPAFVISAASLLKIFLVGVSSGIAVALLEETVMRGAMHTAIQRESGPWTAALLTAPLFAVLHFFAKVHIPAEEVGWGSGFDLIARSFAPLAHASLVFDSFVSWLLLGLILSLTRVLTGNIAVAIGLHAGWVIILRMLQEATNGGNAPAYAAWVGRFDGLLGYWLVPWGLALGVGLWLTRDAWVMKARSTRPLPHEHGLLEKDMTKTFLHVGCGPQDKSTCKGFHTEEWKEIRFDIDPSVLPDIEGTLTDMNAVETASVDAIYSSHNIEHVFPHEVKSVLLEFHRVLKPDGMVVLTCPDLRSVCEAVVNDKLMEPLYMSPAGPIAPLDILYGHREAIEGGKVYMAHKTGFTYKTLNESFLQAGFKFNYGAARPNYFDLWIVSFKQKVNEQEGAAIALNYLP